MEVNATQIITPLDKTEYTTNEDISAVILGLEPIRFCDELLTFNTVPDFIIPFSDVYMTPDSNFGSGPLPHSDLKGLSKPNEGYPRIVGGVDPDTEEIIANSGDIKGGPGKHDVIFDHCQDGKFTTGEDEIKFDPRFNVIGAAEDLPNLEKLRLKASASHKLFEYEESLGKWRIFVATLLSAIAAYIIYRLASNPAAAVAGFIAGELSVGGFLGGVITNIFTGQISGYTNLIEKNKRIAQDPPDFNYQTSTSISQSVNPDFNPNNPLQFKSIPTIIQYTYDLNNEAALTEGLLHSIERYDGFILNGNPAWAVIHANEIKKYSILLKNQILNTSQTVDNLVDSITNDSIFPNESEKSDIEILRNDVRQHGWNFSNIQQMKNLGLDDDQINNVTSQFLSGEIFTENRVSDLLKNTTSTNNSMIVALDDLVEQVDKNINNIITKTSDIFIYDYLPIADAGGPYSGLVDNVISFNGSGSHSSTVSNITKYEWDLNSDGKFDDSTEQNPEISYNYPFKGFAGLKVTNQDDWSDISYSYVNITDINNSPIINDFSPIDLNQTIVLNDNILFSVAATDVDIDDNLSIDWLVDNSTYVTNSQTFEYSPTLNDIGMHLVQAKVTDSNTSNSTTMQTWIVKVIDIDNDLDGWNANIDCEDTNPHINPGIKEIFYNGIDDDCNPITLDNNSPPIANNQTISTLQNVSVSITFTATDVDDDMLNFSIVDNPENGTLSDITIDQFSGLASATYTPNPNFHGTDKLTFIANDGNENGTIGTIDIETLITLPPIAESKSITTDEDTPTDIELNTTINDGHQLQFEILPVSSIDGKKDTTLLGSTTKLQLLDHDSAVTRYTPLPNYQSGTFGMGEDGIIFDVLDPPLTPDQSSQSRGQINIHINPINDAPFSFSKTVRTVENTPIDIVLRATDLENDFILNNNFNNGIKFSILDLPTHGTLGGLQENVTGFNQDLQVNSTENWITYTPSPGFIGEDNFTISANDGNLTGKQSNITIKVTPQNPQMKPQFTNGDLLVNEGFRLTWLDPDGTANKRSDLLTGASVSGGAFDLEGNVYIPEYNGGIVSKYDNSGNLISQFGDKINDYECRVSSVNNQTLCDFWPTAITFDRSGSAYIGGEVFTTDQSRDEVDDIKKFDLNGNLVQKYDVDVLSSGIFGLELGADQCTLHYSSWEGSNTQDPNRDIIKRYDVCENRQLTDFANIFQDPLYDELRFGHQPILDFKLMPDGGMIVAHNALIHHLDSSGKIIKTYNFAKGGNWIAVALDADGKSSWAATQFHLYKIDIETGEVLQFFDIDPLGSITGTMVYGEPKPSLTEISPIVIDQDIVVNQNTPITLNLTGFDANKDQMIFSIMDQPQNGILGPITQINSTLSQVTYISNNGIDTNTDIITYSAIDNTGRDSSNTGTIKISINHRPDAIDDFASTFQEVPVNIPVLDNDTDFDVNNPLLNDSIQIASVNTTNSLGDVIVNNNNNTVTFVPFSTFSGIDSFTYTISDNNKFTDTANVTVNIRSSNIPPIANPQTISIVENTPINLTLTATDPNSNDNLTFIRGSGPLNGFLNNFNATTGQIQYRPLHNFDGIDIYSFKVFDGKDVSQPANITLFITEDGINDPPVIESERVSANVSQQITVDVLQNDIDPDGDLLTLTNFTGPFNGTAVLNQDQTITYQSDPDFNNSDVLYYRVADPSGDFDIGQLIIDVKGNAENQIIQVPSDRLVTTTKNQPINIELVATATIDRPVVFFIIDATNNGTLGEITNLSNLTSSISYTPNNDFVGDDSFTYASIDANGVVSNVGTIRISVNEITGNPPVARDSLVMLDEDTSTPIQLDASDPDVNDVLTYSIEPFPVSGTIVSFDPSTGSLVYEPNPNFNGNDGFLFKAVDQDGLESNIAAVLITVNPVNDPPVANIQQLETDQNTPLQITLSGADPIDNDVISQFRIVNSPTNGQISNFKQMTGELTYTPNNNFFGSDSFTFKVIDSQGLESTESSAVSINVKEVTPPPVNNPPVAVDKTMETNSNTPVSITLEGIDSDQGDTINSFTIISNPTNGQISNFNSNTGTLTYTPNNNYAGQDSFTFKVTDSRGLQSTKYWSHFYNCKVTTSTK